MRCVASSPQAALQALRSRAKLDELDEEEQRLLEIRAFDGEEDNFSADDTEPRAIDDPNLETLLRQALALAADPKRDEKLKKLIAEVNALVAEGFKPVVFCRFIATAQAVAAALGDALPGYPVEAVTGLDPSDERARRVEELGAVDNRVLVATDCLSEGINLQSWFDAVVHYDLCWNPTRHQQREGRVNRFGQKSKRVRTILLYGENNPVDGAVLQVILRKAKRIQKATGVPVPLPDEGRAMTEALMQAVLLRRKRGPTQQLALFDDLPEAQKIDAAWIDASEREKRSQTIYAQRALKPEAVIPEWQKARAALGAGETTRQFLESALQRFSSPLVKAGSDFRFRMPDDKRHAALIARLEAAGVGENMVISFDPGPGKEYVHRTHPLVATIAEMLFERALDPDSTMTGDLATLSRCGAWATRAVDAPTTVVLLRIRHRLLPEDGRPPMLAEEAGALAWVGAEIPRRIAENGDAFALLDAVAEYDLADTAKLRLLENARRRVGELMPQIEAHARARAGLLLEDHGRFPLSGRGDINTYALFAEFFSQSARWSGAVLPMGIASSDTYAGYFSSIILETRLRALISFAEIKAWFPGSADNQSFCLFCLGQFSEMRFAFRLEHPGDLVDVRRQIVLTVPDISNFNPNTHTTTIFRSRAAAELTRSIYARVPVLINERKGAAGNPWGIKFATMFHMSNDSGLFRTARQLEAAGAMRDGTGWKAPESASDVTPGRYVPLYEAKMLSHFDHRFGSYPAGHVEDTRALPRPTSEQQNDPQFDPNPRYWVSESEVSARVVAKGWSRDWLMGWRDITNVTNERTVISAAFPRVGVGDKFLLVFAAVEAGSRAALLAIMSTLTFDYVARQKLGGTSLKYFVMKQLVARLPSVLEPAVPFIVPRVLELTYTSHSMRPFAEDMGYSGPPFAWNEERRALLRAELDAKIARLYGLDRNQLRYILDPEDVMGNGYPSETFRVLKKNEIAKYGDYRTARLVLAAWDRLEREELE